VRRPSQELSPSPTVLSDSIGTHSMRFLNKTAGSLALAVVLLFLTSTLRAQSPEDEGKGLIWYESVQGSSNVDGQVTRFDSVVGYNFNHYFGADLGVPFLFVRTDSTTRPSGSTSADGIGNVYTDLRFTLRDPAVNFISALTGAAPTGDPSKGFGTGRATFDWSNHFDRGFGRLTPFGVFGFSNTVADTPYFVRPFTTLGFNTHIQGGTAYTLWRWVDFNASGYAILPSGQQKVFSKLVNKHSTNAAGKGAHNRGFETSSEQTGTAVIARDEGFNLALSASPSPFFNVTIGYTRSIHYALNTISYGVGFNFGRYLQRIRH
jgi:hypothetical protein